VSEEFEIAQLHKHDVHRAYKALIGLREMGLREEVQVEGVEAFLSNEDNILLIAHRAGTPVGFLTAYFLDRPDDLRPMACLYEIGVPMEHRGRGVGSRLVEAMKDLCRDRDALKMWMVTEASNGPAIALYESTGASAQRGQGDILFTYQFANSDGEPGV